jgi:hypothetical protein
MRTTFLAAAISDDSEMRTEYQTILENNLAHKRLDWVDGGGSYPGRQNTFGIQHLNENYETTSGQHWVAPWQIHFYIGAYGWGSDLPIDWTVQGGSDLLACRNHSYLFVVGRTGSGTDWCYRRAGTFDMTVCYNKDVTTAWEGTVPDWIEDFPTAYDEFIAGHTHSVDTCTAADTLLIDDSEVSDASWDEGSSWITFWPAISYAVDHGASGASAGYARVVASSTYIAKSPRWQAGSGASSPVWAVEPR